MSKMGDYIIRMEEDAAEMSRADFIREYGASNIAIWDDINGADSQEQQEVINV